METAHHWWATHLGTARTVESHSCAMHPLEHLLVVRAAVLAGVLELVRVGRSKARYRSTKGLNDKSRHLAVFVYNIFVPARVAKLVIRARLKILFPFIRKCEFDSHPGHII